MNLKKDVMASRSAVADSSSIILLQKVRLLEVVLNSYNVLITPHIYGELTQNSKKGAVELEDLLGDKIVPSSGIQCIEGLGLGESSAIALYSRGVVDFVILDDKKGANYCKHHAIPFINALLVSRLVFLAEAVSAEEYGAAVELLIREGYYSQRIINKAAAITDAELQQFMPLGPKNNVCCGKCGLVSAEKS